MESKVLVSARHQPAMPAGGATWGRTCRLNAWVAERLAASETFNATEKVPALAGMPLSTPAEFKFSPEGKVPEAREKVSGIVPRVAVRD